MAGHAILAMLTQGRPCWLLFFITLLTLVSKSCQSYVVMRTEAGVAVMEDMDKSRVLSNSRVKREIVEGTGVSGLTKNQKFEMLKSHNHFRSLIKASDIIMMEWSYDLEDMAQSYADKCIFEHSSGRSDTAGFQTIGENLYASTFSFQPHYVVESWYNETIFYNYNTMGCKSGEMCGHYTQVVWASSWALGCGVRYCPRLQSVSFGKGYNVVCHYGPAGNWIGQRPYAIGEICSKCPEDHKFCVRNLCALRPQIGSGAEGTQGSRSQNVFLLFVVIALYQAISHLL